MIYLTYWNYRIARGCVNDESVWVAWRGSGTARREGAIHPALALDAGGAPAIPCARCANLAHATPHHFERIATLMSYRTLLASAPRP